MFIFALSIAVFAAESPYNIEEMSLYDIDEMLERTVFIDGFTIDPAMRDFFINNFQLEAIGLGWEVTNLRDAAFTYFFTVSHNMVHFVDGSVARAPPDEPQYLMEIVFTRTFDNVEMVRYNFPFNNILEMYEYNQLLFFRSIITVPFPPVETEYIIITETIEIERIGYGWRWDENQDWRNKWLYLRLSLDNPVTFFNRMSDGLRNGERVWNENEVDGSIVDHRVSNRVVSFPGLTVGVEVQPFCWGNVGLSFEPNFRINFGDPVNEDSLTVNMFVGLSVKFPLKFINNVKISPFAAVAYALNPIPFDTFYSFPPLEVGGGVQVNLRSGRRNAMFLNVGYMHSIGNVRMHNRYANFPIPDKISYRRFALNIGLGYKFGFITRPAR